MNTYSRLGFLVTSLKHVFRLHLHPTPIGRRLYVTLALRRALGVKQTDALQLSRFGGVVSSTDLSSDALLKIARWLDHLARAPIAVVR